MDKYVITGGPSTGKSTTLTALAQRHFHTVEESSRLVIKREKRKAEQDPAYTPILPKTNLAAFQPLVMRQQLELERQLNGHDAVFLDRSLVDNIAYCELGKVPVVPGIEDAIRDAHYSVAFFLEQIGYVKDEVRQEDPEEAKALHEAIYAVYSRRMPIIIVPAMPVEQRVQRILWHVACRKASLPQHF